MPNLPDLPLELFREIMEALVRLNLKDALRARIACKTFAVEVWQALFTTRLLETKPVKYICGNARVLTEYVLYLAQCGPNEISRSPSLRTLHDSVDHILERCPEYQEKREEFVCSLARRLVEKYSSPKVSDILNRGSMANTREENAMAAACHLGLGHLVRTLLNEGIRQKETFIGWPVDCATTTSDVDLVALLLSNVPQFECHWKVVYKAFENAARVENVIVLKALFDLEGQAGRLDPVFYRVALDSAVLHGDVNLVQFVVGLIFENNIDIGCGEEWAPGHGPHLHVRVWMQAFEPSVKNGHEEVVKYLLRNRKNMRVSTHYVRFPGAYYHALYGASSRGYLNIVQLLLDEYLTLTKADLRYCLGTAFRNGWISVAKLLLNPPHNGGVERIRNRRGTTMPQLLMLAVRSGEVKMVELLVTSRMEVLRGHPEECKQAHALAAASGYLSMVRVFEESGLVT